VSGILCIGGSLDGQRARTPDDLRHLVHQPEYELGGPCYPDYRESVELPPREFYRRVYFRWAPDLKMRLWVENAVPDEEVNQRMYDLFKAGIAALERERQNTSQRQEDQHDRST